MKYNGSILHSDVWVERATTTGVAAGSGIIETLWAYLYYKFQA